MKKRILVTSTDVMMIQFLVPHIKHLKSLGFHVDAACSSADLYEKEGYLDQIRNDLSSDSKVYHIRTKRSPYNLENLSGFKDLRKIINKGNYDLIWTNEPVMSVMTRLAAIKARKNESKVLYLAHGYHFFEGAPKKNWLFYPVEKIMSYFCDCIVVINWEDYHFTQKHFKTPVYHIDGIGVNFDKFHKAEVDRLSKRNELGIAKDDFLIVSVGELQLRKNHQIIIRAISKLKEKRIKYIICGNGELKEKLQKLVNDCGLSDQVFFLGHRYDIPEILLSADLFAHPSQREGLGIATLEAMSVGLPVVTSDVQGIKDYVINGKNGYSFAPNDINNFVKAIERIMMHPELRKKFEIENIETAKKYDVSKAILQVEEIIKRVI